MNHVKENFNSELRINNFYNYSYNRSNFITKLFSSNLRNTILGTLVFAFSFSLLLFGNSQSVLASDTEVLDINATTWNTIYDTNQYHTQTFYTSTTLTISEIQIPTFCSPPGCTPVKTANVVIASIGGSLYSSSTVTFSGTSPTISIILDNVKLPAGAWYFLGIKAMDSNYFAIQNSGASDYAYDLAGGIECLICGNDLGSHGTTTLEEIDNSHLYYPEGGTDMTFSLFGEAASSTYSSTGVWSYEFSSSTAFNVFNIDCSDKPITTSTQVFWAFDIPWFYEDTAEGLACYAQKVVYASVGFLIVPPDWSQNLLEESMNNIKNSFPFSLVFNIVDLANSSAENAENATSTSLGFTIGSTTYNFIEAGMIENAIGQTNKDNLWNAIKAVLYIGGAWTVIGFLL